MTVRKHFKQIVRERMKKTGESYTSARRQMLKEVPTKPTDPRTRWHFPGCGPATTSLRVLLAAAGVNDPHTGEPFTEAMLFGIAGGVGIGVAAFHYAKEDFSSFFIAGRHLWFDDVGYLQTALGRQGIKSTIKESGGVKAADTQLRELLEAGPCIAWVDSAHLPHRAMPAQWKGSGYHIVTVYKIEADHALIGDLTDEPVSISLADLAASRARIVKQKNRLLSIPQSTGCPDLPRLIKGGLSACHKGLTMKGGKGPYAMSTLSALNKWADRLHGSKDKDGWEKIFPPGVNLWRGLTSIYLFIENYGTGGGLCRPMMADFLNEAGEALKDPRMRKLGEQYAELGRGWSELAQAALPDAVPMLSEARELYDRYAELFTGGGSIEDKRQVWARLDKLAKQAKARFPLSDKDCADLRAGLQARVRILIAAEETSLAALADILA
jgi:Domain of unknown function (DUF4872)/Butirosin biosynthesis protein H, N-terminal